MSGLDGELRGIIPRSFEQIFNDIVADKDIQFMIRCSMLEIYNEKIRDLLAKNVKNTLQLRENPDTGVYVNDLTQKNVGTTKELNRWLSKGGENRMTGATKMNKDSSRSHSIFTITIETCEIDKNTGEDHIKVGKLNLVDLAGSER